MMLLQLFFASAVVLSPLQSSNAATMMNAWTPAFAGATTWAGATTRMGARSPVGATVGAVGQARDVTGKWAFAVTTENGTGYPTVILKQEGDKVTGTYESPRLGLRNLEGTVKGDTLRLTMKSAGEGMPDFTFVGVLVDKDNVKGTLEMGGMGSASFTGKRQ